MWHYKLGCWIDDRWGMLNARMNQRGWWEAERHPVLFYIGTVPLTTWLTHPRWGVDSVRRHVAARRGTGEGA